jgi:hypothetical protein
MDAQAELIEARGTRCTHCGNPPEMARWAIGFLAGYGRARPSLIVP